MIVLCVGLSTTWNEKERIVDLEKFLLYELKHYKINTKQIVLYLKLFGHANVLHIDLEKKTYTVFEPHGSEPLVKYTQPMEYLKQKLPNYKKINFYSELNCPYEGLSKEGLQRRAEREEKDKGFCLSWTMLILTFKKANPDIDIPTITRLLSVHKAEQLTQMIRKFTYMLQLMMPTTNTNQTELDRFKNTALFDCLKKTQTLIATHEKIR